MKQYYSRSPYASIEVHDSPQIEVFTEFGEDLPNEGIEHRTSGRFVVSNHVTMARQAFARWDEADSRRAEISQRYALLERAFR